MIEKNEDLIQRKWVLQEIEHDLGCFDVERVIKKRTALYADLGDVVKMLLAAPRVDAVKVVRCKECYHFKPGDDGIMYCKRDKLGRAIFMKNDDYCSYGRVRRNGE